MKTLRILVFLIGAGLFILFLCPLIFIGILNAGNIVGLIISLLILAYAIRFKNVNAKFKELSKTVAGKIFISFILLSVIAVIIFVIWATFKMAKAADNPPTSETTVIVLGCQVKETGPSRMLRERLDAAYKFLSENPDVKCILSGGQGPDEPESEAIAMYNWLAEKGIDKNRLYIEDKSSSTEENLMYSKELIEKEGLNPKVTIITSEFHQYRANKIAKSLGMESYSVSSDTLITLLPTYYLREMGGIFFEVLKFN